MKCEQVGKKYHSYFYLSGETDLRPRTWGHSECPEQEEELGNPSVFSTSCLQRSPCRTEFILNVFPTQRRNHQEPNTGLDSRFISSLADSCSSVAVQGYSKKNTDIHFTDQQFSRKEQRGRRRRSNFRDMAFMHVIQCDGKPEGGKPSQSLFHSTIQLSGDPLVILRLGWLLEGICTIAEIFCEWKARSVET